ncbi:N-acetyltransferase family protein [Paraburkholderia sp. 35.1]|uniref:GNAT family N-acetyltransferase n=1 Tax=Paraburkholderia sp. 35.1 TaxID=2991058 RepID=UPI003D255FF9
MPRKIQLRAATEHDIPLIETWARAIDADRFMSRYLPDRSRTVLWKIVVVDGVEIGTTWVECKAGLPNVVFLGILIGQSELLGKGIGRAVIDDVIADVRAFSGDLAIQLNVRCSNTRAIACYSKCGFVQIASGEKAGKDGVLIPTITMQLAPNTGSAITHSANDRIG